MHCTWFSTREFILNIEYSLGNDKCSLYKQLGISVKQTPVCRVLEQVDQHDYEDFYKKYLHDFVRIVHQCNHTKPEQKIQEYERQEYKVHN